MGRVFYITPPSAFVTHSRAFLPLYPGRAGLAKDAGVSPDGSGPDGIAVNSNAGKFSDPHGLNRKAA